MPNSSEKVSIRREKSVLRVEKRQKGAGTVINNYPRFQHRCAVVVQFALLLLTSSGDARGEVVTTESTDQSANGRIEHSGTQPKVRSSKDLRLFV